MMLYNLEQLQTIEKIADIAVNSGHYQYAERVDGQTVYKNLTTDQAISIIMTGVELGVGPMTALRNITPYRRGKPPIMSAHLESSLAQAHGYQIIELSKSDSHVELAIERNGQQLGSYKLTLEQVKKENKGKLTNNWQTNTLDMLLKTAKVRLVRTYASQALGGAMYISDEMPQHVTDDTPEELGSDDDDDYTEPDDTPPPSNVVDIPEPDDFMDVPDDTDEEPFAPVGSKGNLTDHWRKTLFAVGTEWSYLKHGKSFADVRTQWAQTVFSKELESFGQLNNAGARNLILRMERDIVTELGMRAYENWEEKEAELCRAVSKDTTDSVDECNRSELVRLKAGIKARLDARAEEKEIA